MLGICLNLSGWGIVFKKERNSVKSLRSYSFKSISGAGFTASVLLIKNSIYSEINLIDINTTTSKVILQSETVSHVFGLASQKLHCVKHVFSLIFKPLCIFKQNVIHMFLKHLHFTHQIPLV